MPNLPGVNAHATILLTRWHSWSQLAGSRFRSIFTNWGDSSGARFVCKRCRNCAVLVLGVPASVRAWHPQCALVADNADTKPSLMREKVCQQAVNDDKTSQQTVRRDRALGLAEPVSYLQWVWMLLWSYLIVSLTDRVSCRRCSVSRDYHTNSKLFLSSLLFLPFYPQTRISSLMQIPLFPLTTTIITKLLLIMVVVVPAVVMTMMKYL